MVAGNANYDTALLTMTLQRYLSKTPQDTIFINNALIRVLEKKGQVKIKGGDNWLEPLMYGRNTTGRSYQGWDEGDVSPQEGFTNAQYHPTRYRWSVTISGEEEDTNSGEAQAIDLLQAKWEQAKMTAEEDMNIDLYGDGVATADNPYPITGLALAVDSAGTYGNIVRSNNTWWSSQEIAVGGPLQIQGSTGIRRLVNDCSRGQGQKQPNLFITTQAIHEAYENMLDGRMMFTNRGVGDTGLEGPALEFRGRPIYWDDSCTAQTFFALNTDFLKLYVLKGREFTPSPFKEPINQDGKIAWIYWAGQLVCSNCRHEGKATGINNS